MAKAFVAAREAAYKDTRTEPFRHFLFGDDVDTSYAFLFQDDPEPRSNRKAHLEAMCFVARGKRPHAKKVIGIATERTRGRGASFDFCLVDMPVWTREDEERMRKLQEITGILMSPAESRSHEWEYPPEAC